MKLNAVVSLLALFVSFNGFIMTEELSKHWFKFNDSETHIAAEFPIAPISMEFELSSENRAGEERLKSHTLPQNEGCFFLNSYQSAHVNSASIEDKQLSKFFKTILLPHLFYEAEAIKEHLEINITHVNEAKHAFALFHALYEEDEIRYKISGRAFEIGQILYFYFYVAPEHEFDNALSEKFLNSVHLISKK